MGDAWIWLRSGMQLDYTPICERVRAHGYDSIQFDNYHRDHGHAAPEIVMCHDGCVNVKTPPKLNDVCIDIEMWNTSTNERCWCDARQDWLNCDGRAARAR